jgi:tetratricopeptide (TPR) repeat protein
MPETESVRARILTDRGDHAAARVLLERAATRFPTNFDIWFQRIAALIACGDFDAARAATAAPSGWGQAEKAKVEMLRGQIAAAEWDLDKAYGFFVEASKLNAEDPWTHDCAARMAMLRLDVEAAERHLEASVRASPAHRVRHGGSWKASQTHLGQLLDEFRMDKAAIRGIGACLAKDESLAAIAALVRESPDHTPAAISFIIALRQRGMLAAKGGGPSRIPAKIAQFWDENIPADVEALCEGWREKHPDFFYARFSKVEARRFLQKTGRPEALAAFDRAREPAMKSDIFRLAWLYREGGFYVDADDRCAAPIPTIDPGGYDLILHQEEFATVGNNFIGASPGHPAIGAALAAAVAAVNRGDSDMVWLATGPGLLTRVVAAYLAESFPQRLERTLIMERHELYWAVAIHCATAYKHTEKHWYWAAFKHARGQVASIGALIASRSREKK